MSLLKKPLGFIGHLQDHMERQDLHNFDLVCIVLKRRRLEECCLALFGLLGRLYLVK